MLKQHQVDKIFGALVTSVHMVRAGVAQSPLLGYALLAGFSVAILPKVQPMVEPVVAIIVNSELAQQAERSVSDALRSVEAGLRSIAPEPDRDLHQFGLNNEQLRVAAYVSKKFSVPLGDAQHYVQIAFESAKQWRVDPMLVLAVMATESGFKPYAQSHVGAQGLMQVHTVVHSPKFAPHGGKKMAFDPVANVDVGVQILKEYLRRTSSAEMALKFYVGAANHENDGGYGYKVLSERERILAAASGRPVPAVPLKAPAWLLAKVQSAPKASDTASNSMVKTYEPAQADHASQSMQASPENGRPLGAQEIPASAPNPGYEQPAQVPVVPQPPASQDKQKDADAGKDIHLKVSWTEGRN